MTILDNHYTMMSGRWLKLAKNYIIGLDLGINNVGYSVINEDTNQIEKKGVRLFNPANNAENRRNARNTRRGKKRKENRISESLKLFAMINFPNQNTIDSDLLQKRILGLKEKLKPQEIVNVICYYMSHRGYIPFGDEERILLDLNGQFPCEYYNKLQKDTGKYRALEKVINHSDLKRELEQLLTTQSTFYPELKSIIGDDTKGLLWIFSRKRKFWEGPGSETSFTPYGRFQSEEDVLSYNKEKEQNPGYQKYLFEDLIGHCKIYRDEKCAPKANYYAEEFNLLNDFINIHVTNIDTIKKQEYVKETKGKKQNDYKLTLIALEAILTYCQTFKGKNLTYNKVLKEVLGLEKEDITGFRVKRDGSPEFSLLNIYRYVKRAYQEADISGQWLLQEENISNYNKLMEILAVAPGKVEIRNMLSSIHEFTEEELDLIKNIKDKLKKDGMLQYHALSEKALVRAIKDMKSTCMNFMQVSKKFDYEKEAREYFIKNYGSGEGRLLMTTKYVDEIIASPQVKKTLRQAIHIINAIIKEEKTYPKVIAIESATEMNSKEKAKEIEKAQKQNESYREDAKKILEKFVEQDDKVTENMIERVMLFEELNGACPYCGKPIDLNQVMNNTVEVEHILPLSQSADNSFFNKTLSCRDCNSKKGNKTPFQWLNKEEFETFTKRILSLKLSEEKTKNFLTQEDINKYQIRFFHRNLRDTAYATKELIEQVHLFNNYLKANLNDTEIQTLSTPGQLTHDIRKKWKLEKNRDIGKFHHAVDASIVAGIATTNLGKIMIKSQNNAEFWIKEKEASLKIPEYLTKFSLHSWKEEIEKIKSDEDILISMQVSKDPNRSLSNANITKFIKKEENDYYKILKIDDIYAPDLIKNNKKSLDILFDESNPNLTLLCQEKDPNLFQYLKDIYCTYQDGTKNPFRSYCMEQLEENEEFDYLKHGIKTPSKNGKGVFIKSLRYMQSVSEPYFLNKKNIPKKENTLIGLDSVSIYCIELYWEIDLKKIIFVPVYCPAVDFKTKKVNRKHPIYQIYYKKFLEGKNVTHIVDLFNGNYLEIIKPNGEKIVRFVESYHKNGKKVSCKPDNYLASKDKFTLYDVDILGNKKKRLTWPEN